MPFLLLLSALLTALTGAVTGVRPAGVHIAQRAQATDVRRVAAAVAPNLSGHAHLLGAFGTATPFADRPMLRAADLPATRLYLDRLRA